MTTPRPLTATVKRHNCTSFASFSLFFAIAASAAAADPNPWIELFNGRDLAGWTVRGGQATYAVADGAIVGTNGPGHNTFLCTERTFGDFELELEVRLTAPLNSGIQIRSAVRDEELDGNPVERVHGPQVEIELSPGEAGFLYGERAGGWMTPAERLIPHSHFINGEWNAYRIVAEGPRIRTWINGTLVSDLVDEVMHAKYPSGFIGLQVHRIDAEPGTLTVAWRNIRLRELSADR